jgi:hypothetical protein
MRILAGVGLGMTAIGCGMPALPTGEVAGPVPSSSAFDPAATGTVRGRVLWQGPAPEVPPLDILLFKPSDPPEQEKLVRDNPNAPVIGPRGGVGNAVVFLRGVDAGRCRPWQHPNVEVELHDREFRVRQGEAAGRYGFVRRGERVSLRSRENRFHSVHASGAAFFTLTLPDAGQLRQRALLDNGVVELTSAAGYYWMRAYLFVDEHPYYIRTAADGQFVLPLVPPGRYQLVCWLPSWQIARQERSPETGHVLRLIFAAPLEIVQEVEVRTAETARADFQLSLDAFPPPAKP